MNNINKTIFLNAVKCPTLGWMMRNGELDNTLTISSQFRIEQGKKVGKRAQNLYPEGVNVYTPSFKENAIKTKGIIDGEKIPLLFEAAFLVDNYAAKADILKLKDNKWKMIEVKSGINDKEKYIDDMAYTTLVINKSGIDISQISLFLISSEYRLGMSDNSLFREIDHTDEVFEKVKEFEQLWIDIDKVTSNNKPSSALQYKCKDCEIFYECEGKKCKNNLFDIPRLGETKFNSLIQSGVSCVEEIPDGFSLTPKQKLVKNCVKSNHHYINENLKKELESIIWPAFYLDFETCQPALPFLPETPPYEQIPTQYSIHKCNRPGEITEHFEYLSELNKDCRKNLANKLISDLGVKGSIIVYSSFEKRILNYLKNLLKDHENYFNMIIGRLVDLESIIKNNYYMPDFHGKTSVKVTCPALIPDISYDGFEISDGLTASAIFSYMLLDKYDDKEVEKNRENLLKYCKQDSLAMVRLHEKLSTIVN